jgi:DNA-binding NarL/FixJ family response regulator
MPAVLIVENEIILALDLADTLSAMGYDVFGPATTADDACRMARDTQPDVVLMDISLNGTRDGIAAAEEIIAEQGSKVIFLSSEDDIRVRQRAAAVHAFGWLDKPCAPSHIRKTIERACLA